MDYRRHLTAILLSFGLLAGVAQARVQHAAEHGFFHVRLGAASAQPTSGRLLLFATDAKTAEAEAKAESKGKSSVVEEVDANPFRATETSVAGREVDHWMPGQEVDIDVDRLAFPAGWSKLPPGDYYVQAVLDVDHDYNYGGRGAGDLISAVVKMHLPASSIPTLSLERVLPAHDPWVLSERTPEAQRKALPAVRQHARLIDFDSPSLGAFWGRTIHMRGRVLLPPDYHADSKKTWPVVYYTQGFGGNNDRVIGTMTNVYTAMAQGEMPPMIWVFLDESGPTGTHDSPTR